MEIQSNKKHILIVDDDPLTRRLFGSKLAAVGFEVLYAKDGNEGREMARRLQPDLILLDINMPVMTGLEAAQRMKSESETAKIPIIFLSNTDISIEGQKMMNDIGVAGYIYKGADLADFVAFVQKTLGL